MFFYSDGDALTYELTLMLFVHYCTNLNKGEQFLNIKLSEVGGSPEKSLFYVINKLKPYSFHNFLSPAGTGCCRRAVRHGVHRCRQG